MKVSLSLLFVMTIQCFFSQVSFEKGYIIDNDNNKKEVLIKNGDWINNPLDFTYKNDENSPENIGNISNTKEFGVTNYKRLVRYKGNMDYSPSDIAKLSSNKDPEYKYKEVFLYVLVSGKVNLYSYRDKDVTRYFYSTADDNILPLEYRKYYSGNDEQLMTTNSKYKTQLEKLMLDNPEVVKKIKLTNYTSQDLTVLFNQYNNILPSEKSKGKLNLRIRPGVTFSNFKIEDTNFPIFSKLNYSTKIGFRAGVELEWILPFNKNKWGVIFEPSFMSYKSDASYNSYTSNVKYSTLDFALGLRHYFFLNNDSKLFANAQVVLNKTFTENSEVDFVYSYGASYSTTNKLNVSTKGASFAIGIGYNYKKLSVEARYNTNRNITEEYANWNSKFGYSSIIFGYNIS